MVYSKETRAKKKATPQTEAIPGREAEMEAGRSGAVAFSSSMQQKLRRFLLTGTIGGSYYASQMQLTDDLFKLLEASANSNPKLLADEILYATKRGVNNHTPILALVHLSKANSTEAKTQFKAIFNDVIRTGSHFHEWANYNGAYRGWGQCVLTAAQKWLAEKPSSALAYQLIKYQSRYDQTWRDNLRLIKPKTADETKSLLYSYSAGRMTLKSVTDTQSTFDRSINQGRNTPPTIAEVTLSSDSDLSLLHWFEWLKQNPDQGERAVREGKLPMECVTGVAKMNREVWQALFEQMPIEATVRNLGSLTELGVLGVNERNNLKILKERLENTKALAKIHPVNLLKAMLVYKREITGKSSKSWTPVPRIVDLLEEALERSFEVLPATGKTFFHAVDVSGSMSWNSSPFGPNCCQIAAAMCLASIKAEENYFVGGFFRQFRDLGFSKKQSFGDTVAKIRNQAYGSTDASCVYDYAIRHKFFTDVFVFWTDNESWAGSRHPSQALKEYRQKINPNARAVYVALEANNITLVDPKDTLSFDIAGFSSEVPAIIQAIAKGEL